MKKPAETVTKKALIFDLDNTIYPVSAIGNKLFAGLYDAIERSGAYQGNLAEIKDAIQRKPFQVVAQQFGFSNALLQEGLSMLSELEYTDAMAPFDDYRLTKELDGLKFLVTTGFTKLQESKIRQLDIGDDFEACFIVDPAKSTLTKKDIFKEIAETYQLKKEEILVIGDDIHSEIQAAEALGIDAVVYDRDGLHQGLEGYAIISDFSQLGPFLST